MDLLDWMAGQALEKASKGVERTAEDIAKRAYYIASAMLAEKARREADHSKDKPGKVPSQSALIRSGWDLFTWADKTMDETDECRVFLHNWKEAVRSQGEDHSPDAGKVAKLETLNRELVEALKACEYAFSKFAPQEESAYGMAWIKARAALAKAKGVA